MNLGTKIFWIIWLLLFIVISTVKIKRQAKHQSRYRAAKKVYRKINQIYAQGNESKTMWILSYLRKIDPFVFEELILYSMKRKGFKVWRNRRYTGDGGIDGRVRYNGEKFLIQAKRYSEHIKLSHVENFIKVCRKEKKRGFFIHTGKTGEETRKLVRENPQIIILSGWQLYNLFVESERLEIPG